MSLLWWTKPCLKNKETLDSVTGRYLQALWHDPAVSFAIFAGLYIPVLLIILCACFLQSCEPHLRSSSNCHKTSWNPEGTKPFAPHLGVPPLARRPQSYGFFVSAWWWVRWVCMLKQWFRSRIADFVGSHVEWNRCNIQLYGRIGTSLKTVPKGALCLVTKRRGLSNFSELVAKAGAKAHTFSTTGPISSRL